MTNRDIIKDEYAVRLRPEKWTTYGVGGRLLTMADGSVWFHPYSGSTPVCERPADEEAKP